MMNNGSITPGDGLHPQGVFTFTHVRDGKLLSHEKKQNSLTYFGKNTILSGIFKNGAQIPELYFGIATNKDTGFYEILPTDTGSTHPGWDELTGYVVAPSKDMLVLRNFGGFILPFASPGQNAASDDQTAWAAEWNSAKHTNRERFLGIPHVTTKSAPGGATIVYDRTLYLGASPTDTLPSGVILPDFNRLPLFQINASATIVGVFLATGSNWNNGTDDIFAYTYCGPGLVQPGDWVQFAYQLAMTDGTSISDGFNSE